MVTWPMRFLNGEAGVRDLLVPSPGDRFRPRREFVFEYVEPAPQWVAGGAYPLDMEYTRGRLVYKRLRTCQAPEPGCEGPVRYGWIYVLENVPLSEELADLALRRTAWTWVA